jgi:hypothetical protein
LVAAFAGKTVADMVSESEHVLLCHAVTLHYQLDQWVTQQVAEPCFTVGFCAHDDPLLCPTTNVASTYCSILFEW